MIAKSNMRPRNSWAMVLQETGGAESGRPKGPEVNARHTAANRPENVGCLHKTLLPGVTLSWSGWLPAGQPPSPLEVWGQPRLENSVVRYLLTICSAPTSWGGCQGHFLMEKIGYWKSFGGSVGFFWVCSFVCLVRWLVRWLGFCGSHLILS